MFAELMSRKVLAFYRHLANVISLHAYTCIPFSRLNLRLSTFDYSWVAMAVESKHVMTITKQKREVEKRETQYARNKVCINHAHAIRRTGIYSIS